MCTVHSPVSMSGKPSAVVFPPSVLSDQRQGLTRSCQANGHCLAYLPRPQHDSASQNSEMWGNDHDRTKSAGGLAAGRAHLGGCLSP